MIHPLRAYRDRTGKTLDEIAAAAQTSRSWLSRIENGEEPSKALRRRIVAACGGALTDADFVQSPALVPAEGAPQ